MNKILSILAAAVLTTVTLGVHASELKPVTPSPGQPTGTPPATPTWTVPGAQPSNITIKQKSGHAVLENPAQNARNSGEKDQLLQPYSNARGIEKKDVRRGMVISK